MRLNQHSWDLPVWISTWSLKAFWISQLCDLSPCEFLASATCTTVALVQSLRKIYYYGQGLEKIRLMNWLLCGVKKSCVVSTRTIAATTDECVQCRLGRNTPLSGCSSKDTAEEVPRPNILFQLNTKGFTTNKISVIRPQGYKNKAFIIILQKTHCTNADKLVIPKFSLAESVLCRKHGLAMFADERLECWLVDQSSEQAEADWLFVDVTGYKIINVYKHPCSRLSPTACWRSHTPVCMLVTSTAIMSTEITAKHPQLRAWSQGPLPTTSRCCATQREQSVSPLTNGMLAPTWTWPLRVSVRTTNCWTDMF